MISKDYIPDNHALTTFHRVKQITSHPPFTMATVEVVSYASEDAFLAGAGNTWANRLQMPLVEMTGALLDHAEAWLIGDNGSPFAGGLVVIDKTETLENAKERAWNRIKRIRDIKEASDFSCDGHVYQADKARISGACLAALMAQLTEEPYSIEFTLSNNDVITLSAAQMMAVGGALAQHVDGVFATGRLLRDQIDAAGTIAELAAITW